jgi:hypothetical protein
MKPRKKEEDKKVKFAISLNPKIFNRMDKEMINTIRDMSNENKMDIIISFNTVLKYLKIMLDI